LKGFCIHLAFSLSFPATFRSRSSGGIVTVKGI